MTRLSSFIFAAALVGLGWCAWQLLKGKYFNVFDEHKTKKRG